LISAARIRSRVGYELLVTNAALAPDETNAASAWADRRPVALVSTPDAVPFFAAMGFLAASHGH
jgi:hypothetical protein